MWGPRKHGRQVRLSRGRAGIASAGVQPRLLHLWATETGFHRKHVEPHIARLAQEWADLKEPQNYQLENAPVFSPLYLRTLAHWARKTRKYVNIHRS